MGFCDAKWCALLIALAIAPACRTARPRAAPDDVLAALVGPFGEPIRISREDTTHRVVRSTYALEHSDRRHVALWVAHRVTRDGARTVHGYRRPHWRAESQLPAEQRAELDDFARLPDGFVRGHLAPSADFGTKEERDQTFFLSNAVPQDERNNGGLWNALERRVRSWACDRRELFVITGVLVDKSEAEARPAIPTHLYKIALANDGSHAWKAIAFIVENRPYESPYDFDAIVVAIDTIESAAGLDFFPRLPNALERTLEGTKPAVWPDASGACKGQ